MSWQKVKLGQFLKNREGRFKPNDSAIQGLKRIEKIDFSGTIHLSEKASNTDMILVKKGDLVISGINVEKGAMNIYQGDEDVVATIHYSSYEFDEKQIDIDFLTNFLKSLEFKKALKEQVPGGIKTEIKPKHILPLLVEMPTDIEEQKKVVKKLNKNNSIIENVSSELTHQLDLIKQLRQAFLREAMQGRFEFPQQPLTEALEGKGLETGHDLLAKIKAEKAKLIAEKKLKKEKELSPITVDEIPFEIPEHWAWCRLGEIGICKTGTTPSTTNKDFFGSDIPFIKPADVTLKGLITDNEGLSLLGLNEGVEIPENSLMMVCIGGSIGKSYYNKIRVSCNQQINTITPLSNISAVFLQFWLQSSYFQKEIWSKASGGTTPIVNRSKWESIFIPLPPLHEQEQIVAMLEELMAFCDGLEQSIKESQGYNEKLLQQVLREALKGGEK